MLAKLVAATGHELTLGLERSDPSVQGLPDSPLGRRVRQHRRALHEAVADAGAENLRVFGSVARGQDTPTSDVDLLVDLPPGTGLFALLALQEQLQQILHVDINLATANSLKPQVRAEALAEAIVVIAGTRYHLAHHPTVCARPPTRRRHETRDGSDLVALAA